MDTPYQNFCRALKAKQQWRELAVYQPSLPGQIRHGVEDFINFSSNDYLGLSRHKLLRSRAISYAQQYGMGAGGSRLVSGNIGIFTALEDKLARAVGKPASLILNSGYQANSAVLPALMDRSVLGIDAIAFGDRLNHNSIWQGIKLSGAELHRYQHNNLTHLESMLEKSMDRKAARFIISETLFGMDGDRADIPGLIALAKKYDAFLYLDDAHAIGVFGKDGFGLASDYAGDVDCIMGTFGKAMGGFGAYIACSAVLRDYLINRCGGFMFATALPPMVVGAIDAAIELVPSLSIDRARLLSNAEYLRSALKPMLDVGQSNTHIIPVLLGAEDQAKTMQRQLENLGILAVAIRPPTVPAGTSRLRLSLTTMHTTQHLDQLIEAVRTIQSRGSGLAAVAA